MFYLHPKRIIMRILIVDDETKICKILKSMLSELGHTVVAVEHGSYALNLLRADLFDVIILDILMDEMNGVDVVKKIKEMGIKVKIIVLTSIDDEGIKKYITELGINQYIIKPYNLETVKDTINNTILSFK